MRARACVLRRVLRVRASNRVLLLLLLAVFVLCCACALLHVCCARAMIRLVIGRASAGLQDGMYSHSTLMGCVLYRQARQNPVVTNQTECHFSAINPANVSTHSPPKPNRPCRRCPPPAPLRLAQPCSQRADSATRLSHLWKGMPCHAMPCHAMQRPQ